MMFIFSLNEFVNISIIGLMVIKISVISRV